MGFSLVVRLLNILRPSPNRCHSQGHLAAIQEIANLHKFFGRMRPALAGAKGDGRN
jgi:hypothetical protein